MKKVIKKSLAKAQNGIEVKEKKLSNAVTLGTMLGGAAAGAISKFAKPRIEHMKVKHKMKKAAKNKAASTTYKMGGSTKDAKLAALAEPKNKITRADIITGAKRNNKKK